MNASSKSSFVVIVSAALVSPACIQVEADIPSACFLQSDVSMTAVAPVGEEILAAIAAAQAQGLALPAQFAPELDSETTFTREGLEEIPQTFDDIGVQTSVSLSFVDVFATKGLKDFSGIEAIHLRMAPTDPDAGLPPVDLAVCVAANGCDTSGTQVRLEGSADVDLVPYLEAGSLDFTLTVQGAAPLDLWSFDVDVCMNGSGRYDKSLF